MDERTGLETFAALFRERIQLRCEEGIGDEERFQENVFTQECLQTLLDGEEIFDSEIFQYEHGTTMKVNAASFSDGEDSLDLFVSLYHDVIPPLTVRKEVIDATFRKLERFFFSAVDGVYSKLEETAPVYALARKIYELRRSLHRIRFFVLTDGRVTQVTRDSGEKQGYRCSYAVWDIARLHRLESHKFGRETIEIDFKSRFGESIPCLMMPVAGEFDHETCVAIFSGKILADLYEDYGQKLLQRNVRSFLQSRGSVNSGIRETILKEPDRFLAYNNGITATAADVKFAQTPSGWVIEAMTDFQIVNGGQTTAGIYYARLRKAADLSKVFVSAKISRIKSIELINKIVPLISKYANSQNKVSESDFASNDPFHVRLHELSQTVWVPVSERMSQPTHWYYERARGQYAEEKIKRSGSAKFARENPPSQIFDKTEVAKVISCWDLVPFTASLGPQKNFLLFSKKLGTQSDGHAKDSGASACDHEFFKKLIAKIVFYRTCKKLIENQKDKYPANRANVVYYTISYMVHKGILTESVLSAIWKEQCVEPNLQVQAERVFAIIYENIVRASGSKIVAEHCKKEACWNEVRELVLR